MNDINDFEWLLEKYPSVHEQIDHLFKIIENTRGDVRRADDAEDQITHVLRELGQRTLTSWAEHCQVQASAECKSEKPMRRDKKNSVGTVVTEPLS